MDLSQVDFTFNKTPEENLALFQQALKEAETPKDRITVNQMYSSYVKTLPHQQKLLKMELEKAEAETRKEGEPRIEFAISE